MEKYITSFELEEMKQQICLLKEKLEKQTIINDNMIRQAMQQKVSRMHKDAIIMIIVATIGIPYVGLPSKTEPEQKETGTHPDIIK